MRREHKDNSGGSQPIPFEEDLIFYAPLTQGDLTDHVSGTTGQLLTDTTMTWDANKGMYLFHTSNPGYGDSISSSNGGLYFSNVTEHTKTNITVAFTAEQYSATNGNGYDAVIMYGNRTQSQRTFIPTVYLHPYTSSGDAYYGDHVQENKGFFCLYSF